MNWIILLLLFGCGGRGWCNDCRRDRGNDCCNDCRNDCCSDCRNDCRSDYRSDCCRQDNSRECACAREAVREAKEDMREAREDMREAMRDVREAREREQAACDGSGMVPPPWKDYPPMPRRDKGYDNDNDNDRDCGCSN